MCVQVEIQSESLSKELKIEKAMDTRPWLRPAKSSAKLAKALLKHGVHKEVATAVKKFSHVVLTKEDANKAIEVQKELYTLINTHMSDTDQNKSLLLSGLNLTMDVITGHLNGEKESDSQKKQFKKLREEAFKSAADNERKNVSVDVI